MKIQTDKKYGIGVTDPKHQLEIRCLNKDCKNQSFVDTTFSYNLLGVVQICCNECKTVFNVPEGVWGEAKL